MNDGRKRRVPLDSIDAGLDRVVSKTEKDEKDRQEEAALAAARTRAKTAQITEANIDIRHNRIMRNSYANRVFCYLICYSVFAAIVLLLSGFKVFNFELPTAALTAVVGSTAVSAIGLVGIVVTGLF